MIAAPRVAVLVGMLGCGTTVRETRVPAPAPPVTSAPTPVAGDHATGFDLYVDPPEAAITRWALDGEPRTDQFPVRVRGISPGRHIVTIDTPGFKREDMDVLVELGRSSKVVITLRSVEVVAEPDPVDLLDTLDSAMVRQGVGMVKGRIMACGNGSVTGAVKINVKVKPDGKVASVTVREAPDVALGDCVARAMQTATFARTRTGGSFNVPYVF